MGDVEQDAAGETAKLNAPEPTAEAASEAAGTTEAVMWPTDAKTKDNTHLNALPVPAQWVLSVLLLGGMIAWIALGNVAKGTIGSEDCPTDSWAAPLAAGAVAYLTAFGYFGMSVPESVKELIPLFLLGGFSALFASLGALLPFVIGCSSVRSTLLFPAARGAAHADR